MEYVKKEKYLQTFFMAILAGLICFLPMVIINHGNFFYYADYNKQQIMFYTHMHDMVKNGWPSWDWAADLGSDTVSSYSFYLLGSPFFWLSLLVPSKFVVAAMPWFIVLKSAIASVGAYGYTRCFCKNTMVCAIAGILFGLSSFHSVSIIYNHFHDAILILPFMLWAFEKLILEGKTGFFAITVAISAITNYYFFFGQVIFVIVYFIVGLATKHFSITPKRFGKLVFEAFLGVSLSLILLLPSAMAIINNPRVTSFLSGQDLFIYRYKSIYLYIIKNMFMQPNITLIKNFGVSRANELDATSYTSYLPLFSLIGVISYIRNVKGRDFFKVLIVICGLFMFIPVLNQSFSFFNTMFYGRWFYMPILIASVMTAKSLELYSENKADLKKGFIPTTIITVIVVCTALTVMLLSKKGIINVGFEDYTYPYIQILFTVSGLFFMWNIIYHPESNDMSVQMKKIANRTLIFCTACMCTIVWYSYLRRGTSESQYMNSTIAYANAVRDEKLLNNDDFYRVSSGPNLMNMPVIWGESTVRYFNSTVEPSIINFYNGLGITRTVKSSYESTYYPLMTLLSVKYYYDEPYYDSDGIIEPIEATLTGTKDTFISVEQKYDINIFENTEYIPMGFTFDKYTTNEDLSSLPSLIKSQAYLEALVLNNEQIEKYSKYLEKYDISKLDTFKERYSKVCNDRRNESCYYFKKNGNSFNAKIKLDNPNLVFFSVPYSEGWNATVNGEKADVEQVDNGLMAVLCDAGDNEIKFEYKNKYFDLGKIITLISVFIFILYIVSANIIKLHKQKRDDL